MTKIILHGHLKELYPHEIRVQANSAAEALQSLALIPALQRYPGERHSVRVDGFDSSDALYDKRNLDVIHVRPIIAGAGGNGGWTQVIIGITMIAVAIFAPEFLPAMISQGSLVLAGSMMVLGGVLQLLAPQPSINISQEERSRYLGNGRNTVGIGTRIPMLIGRHKAYGHYLSFDIDASVFDSAPAEWYSSTFTNYGELTNSAAPMALPMEDPATVYHQPTSVYTGASHPTEITDQPETYINFEPVELLAGIYDINFATGLILHTMVVNSGSVTRATVLGGRTSNLPLIGTPIAFTQNHG